MIKILILAYISTFSAIWAQSLQPIEIPLPTPLNFWFYQQTGHSVGIEFGIYKLQLHGDDLFLGIGAGLPADRDGALIAKVDLNTNITTALHSFTEQGFIDMSIAENHLVIPGVDPASPYSWDSGSFYTLNLDDQENLNFYRNLPLVVHGWGQWYDEVSRNLYHAASQVLCDNPTAADGCLHSNSQRGGGAIFLSENLGQDWIQVQAPLEEIGTFRTYDINGDANTLYVTWSDQSECGIAYSTDRGISWTRSSLRTICSERLYSKDSGVWTIEQQLNEIIHFGINSSAEETIQRYALPSTPTRLSVSHIEVDSKNTIYFAAQDGVYKKPPNSSRWTKVFNLKNVRDFEIKLNDDGSEMLYMATASRVYYSPIE